MVGHMKSKANVNKAFISQLYTHYAPQLHAFQAEYLHHPVNMRFGHELVSLETTGMCFKRLGERAIYAPALKRLAIRQAIYHRLPWAAFYDDGGSSGKTLAFQSLTCLQLEYNCGDSQVDRALNSTIPVFPKQLLFPKLQKLEVTGFLLSCPVMFNAQLPPQLRKMRLMCPVRVARVLASRTLPTAFDISCGIITDLIDNDPDPMKAANALLGALRATERLFVDYSVLGANCWADMEWSSITSLKIRSRVSASDILLLVSRVPRVQSLNLWGVHVSEPELEDIVEKFSSKYPDANFHDVALRTLHLHRAADGVCIYSCFRFVEILRRTIPGLRTITLDGTSRA
ncbi:hypothetical protein H4R19_000408 [Coemansia spiralis]|nr:hypothetical protein H4R19_000408 [Coemansia spiralis]